MAKRTIAALAAAFLVFAAFAALADNTGKGTAFYDWAKQAFEQHPNTELVRATDGKIGIILVKCPQFQKNEVTEFSATAAGYAFSMCPEMEELDVYWRPATGSRDLFQVTCTRPHNSFANIPNAVVTAAPTPEASGTHYVLNTNTMKFHDPNCNSAKQIKEKNREDFVGDRQEVINRGFVPCKLCNP